MGRKVVSIITNEIRKVMLKFMLSGSGAKYVLSSVISLTADYLVYYFLLSAFSL